METGRQGIAGNGGASHVWKGELVDGIFRHAEHLLEVLFYFCIRSTYS